jgi:ssDNA-binding Zn-finger/Zn-ribbon topoisomerase 1
LKQRDNVLLRALNQLADGRFGGLHWVGRAGFVDCRVSKLNNSEGLLVRRKGVGSPPNA